MPVPKYSPTFQKLLADARLARAAAGGQGVVCWNAVKNVQMSMMWKGKPSPSVLRQWSRHKGQRWLLRALGCQALWTPRTWPPGLVPILPPGQSKRGDTTGVSESRGCLLRHGGVRRSTGCRHFQADQGTRVRLRPRAPVHLPPALLAALSLAPQPVQRWSQTPCQLG